MPRSVLRALGVGWAAVALVAWSTAPVLAQEPTPPQIESGVAPGEQIPDTRPGEAFADPKLAELQRTASQVQSELSGLAEQIHGAETELAHASETLAAARVERTEADAVVAERQGEMDQYTAAVYSANGEPNQLEVLLTANSPDDFLDGASYVSTLRADAERRLRSATARQSAAATAEHNAEQAEQAANARTAELAQHNSDASNRAAAVSSELRGTLASTNEAVVAAQQAQQQRNQATAANWRTYVGTLASAGITPPKATALRDPARLPAGLQPLPGATGAPSPGVASAALPSGEKLLVLPAEVVAAVSTAVDALGRPFVPGKGGEGPTAYSCDGLVHSAYAAAGLDLPAAAGDQLSVLNPVAAPDVQPGDLVFLGPARYGVQGVGVVLDGRTMLTADGRLAGVVVTDLPGADTVLGFARPALGTRPAQPVPQRTDDGLRWRCGGVELPPNAAGQRSGAWGGYPNGLIPLTALCPIGAGSHVLRCDAAQSFQAMSNAYRSAFGGPICVTDSYRTFDAQVRLYGVKPSLAAVPGTSNHGWGLATDLCGGVQDFGTAQYAWLSANAGVFGWTHPGWARQGGGREEPWHWEYVG